MIIKDKFNLFFKDIPNILHLSEKEIIKYSIPSGQKNLLTVLDLNEDNINHYSKKQIYNFIGNVEKRKHLVVINYPEYNLHISYNEPTDYLLFNISPYDVDNIYTNNIDFKNIYAQMVYGLCFYNLASRRYIINPSYFVPISNYLLTIFVSIFGKEYGLFGAYTNNITKLNFLITCYVLSSFFGITGEKCYKMAFTASSFPFQDLQKNLDKYNFSNIEDFIKSLSDLRVFPGINRYSFTKKVISSLGVSFLPALEDIGRFISIMSCVDIKGSSIINTNISKYDNQSFLRIIEISKLIFK